MSTSTTESSVLEYWLLAFVERSNQFLSWSSQQPFFLLYNDNDTNNMAAVSSSAVVLTLVIVLSILVGQSGSEALRPSHWIRKLQQQQQQQATSSSSSSSSSSSGGGILFSSKASLESSWQWWEDLAPPFALTTVETTTTPNQPKDKDPQDYHRPHKAVDVVHFCFLVHGYRGYSRDLSYLQTVMQRVADTELRKQQQQQRVNDDNYSNNQATGTPLQQQDVVVHAAVCNEKRTDDGVVLGGDRLVTEIRQVIHDEMQKRQGTTRNDESSSSSSSSSSMEQQDLPKVTISMLGNSLGGLYARYAIAKLLQHCTAVDDESTTTTNNSVEEQQQATQEWILDGKYRLSFNIFCTTATPHLGVAGHTFLPIPRTAEVGFAQVMRSTGRDLFRCNDLLRRMATTAEYLQPLGHFRQRIAYANAYGTDFPVPCQTAGFLNEESASPHYFYDDTTTTTTTVVTNEGNTGEAMDVAEAEGLIIAKVYTPRRTELSRAPTTTTTTTSTVDTKDDTTASDILESSANDEDLDESRAWAIEMDKEDELKIMSQTLDTLGWKKVFVDARKNMPKIPLFGLSSSSSRSNSSIMEDESNSSGADDDDNLGADDRQARSESIALLKQKGVVESRHLASAVTAPLFDENFHWPVGHNMIVAFSRSRLSTYLNKAGRPVVDSIAKNLVRDILDWPLEQDSAVPIQEKVAA